MEELTVKEPWYTKTFLICIVIVLCSWIPFASLLVIPLILLKSKHFSNLGDKTTLFIKDKMSNELIAHQNKIQALDQTISEKDAVVQDIITKANEKAQGTLSKIQEEIAALDQELREKKESLIELDEEILLQEFALYKPQYEFANSDEYKQALDQIREKQKFLIKSNLAASEYTNWTVDGSVAKGRKMVSDIKKLLLRAFNGECEHLTKNVKYNNFDSYKKRIESARTAISRLGKTVGIAIYDDYYDLKIQELHLAFEYQQKKQEEKERQKEIRAQEREEAKLQKEIEEARKKIEKEKTHYTNALEAAQHQLAITDNDAEREELNKKIAEIENQMTEIDKNLSDIDYREANQRAGYVYVISNIGSFGTDIYKIGMTRRLDPTERVDELGDASVPFNFDIHAMIFSDDAPKLETALHHAFEDKKLNMINTRREFFHVSLDEIERVVKENFDGTVEFVKIPDAEQYRESNKLREAIAAPKEHTCILHQTQIAM